MNPFDQFATDFNAALPQKPQASPPFGDIGSMSGQPPPFNLMGPASGSSTTTMPMSMSTMPTNPGGMAANAPMMTSQNGSTASGALGPFGSVQGPTRQMMMPTPSMTGGFLASSPINNSAGSSTFGAAPMASNRALVGPGAIVPSSMQSNPYSLGPPQQAAAPFGQPPQQQHSAANPFGAPQMQNHPRNANTGGMINAMDPFASTAATNHSSALVMASDPWAAPPAPSSMTTTQTALVDPWGAPPAHQQQMPPPSNALVPSSSVNDDPFGIFGTVSPAPTTFHTNPPPKPPSAVSHVTQPTPAVSSNDPWADMGFGPAEKTTPAPAPAYIEDEGDLFGGGIGAAATRAQQEARVSQPATSPSTKEKTSRPQTELPPGGEWYDAKIFTPTLGVMFFKPKELVDSLFLQTDKRIVDGLADRPVVAFIVEGSSARSAGVELGHVLLKVNGIDVRNPKEASRLIKEGPRPLPMLFYVPETTVVVAEGEHMVKYNTKETGAPNSAKDWKPKYVVIGGIIAQPWMMNMYRSKAEYDIAVIETQARRPISVKVKQFSLQGARIQNDWQGPQMVKYKNKLHPWKYFVILPISKHPIKIASPNLSQLKPVHEGVRRVLNSQQRGGGGPGENLAVPVSRDPYGEEENRARSRDNYDHSGGAGGGYNGTSRRGGY